MRTLRSKIFLFVILLLVLPAVPLSVIVMQLLEKSYKIGVNQRVEQALDGALAISSEFYRLKKTEYLELLRQVAVIPQNDPRAIREKIIARIPQAQISFAQADGNEGSLIPLAVLRELRQGGGNAALQPADDHMRFYGWVRRDDGLELHLELPLPEVFQQAAPRIQEVNQVYTSLNLLQNELRTSFLFTFLLVYGLGIIAALVVSWRISKRITRPIESMAAAARTVGSGNLDFRIEPSGGTEFSELARAFNQMLDDLQANQRKIIELEKMATWQQLARRLAHEIKNPLTPIQLTTQQMRDAYKGDDDEYRKLLGEGSAIIEEEVNSLQRLVREFSDFARLPEFTMQRQDLRLLLESLRRLYKSSAVRFEFDDVPIPFTFDYDYLKRALINLIDNALAAIDDNGSVLVCAKVSQNELSVSVEDDGQGIGRDTLTKIFEPYYSTKRSGVGLGLAIVKKIIEEHGGTITVQSEQNKGSVFKMEFQCDRKQDK